MKIKSAFKSRIAFLLMPLVVLAYAGWFFLSYHLAANDVRNILLISIDTCRADHLSCYGYPRRTTPNIDQLAQEGILFTNVYTLAPFTLPAHSSMLTGTVPPYHGIRDNGSNKLGQSNVTLAEILKGKGFYTGAIVSTFILDSKFGLHQGFDYYNDRFEKPGNTLDINERTGEEANRLAFEWLDRHKRERFFLFLHYYEPHYNYTPPEPFASSFQDNLYAGEIAYTDYCIGQVIEKLKEMGLYESTLIIVTSDHGEMRGEHGERSHGYFIYQSVLKVPLIFKLPGNQKGKKIDDSVSIIDIVPTLYAVLGIKGPDHVQGQDLSGYFEEKHSSIQDRPLYCESMTPTRYGANSLMGVIADGWKYIQTTRPELYDLVEDPGETNNLAKQQPYRARILNGHLRQILEESVRKDSSDSKAELDEEDRKRLESLGYLANTSVSENFKFDQSKDDPKDLIRFHELLGAAHWFVFTKQYTYAKAKCEEMLKERPQFFTTYYYLATIAVAQDNFAGAVSYLTEVVCLKPDEAMAHSGLGSALAKLNKTEKAIKHFSEALRINPEFAEAHNNLGSVLVNRGRVSEAIKHYSEALRVNPEFADAHNNLANILDEQGRTDEAIEHYSRALEINPEYAEAHNNLGSVLVNRGRIPEATKHFSEAIRINPGYAEAHNNLGFVLTSQGKIPEATKHYSDALRINPGFADAHNGLGVVLANQGRTEEAIKHFSEALRIRPDLVSANKNLKKALAHRGRTTKSEQ